jgi:hypothetical protein
MEDMGQSIRGVVSCSFGINNTGLVVGDSEFHCRVPPAIQGLNAVRSSGSNQTRTKVTAD